MPNDPRYDRVDPFEHSSPDSPIADPSALFLIWNAVDGYRSEVHQSGRTVYGDKKSSQDQF